MEDADEAPVIRQTESAQSLIGKFFHLIKSGDIEHYLSEYTPAAQAHLIDEIKVSPCLKSLSVKIKPLKLALPIDL